MLESAMLKLGIIGCGKVTTMFHLKAIRKIGALSVKAVSDIDKDSMIKAQQTCGADRCYENYIELLEDPDIQAVVVCTPPYLHGEMALMSIENNKHVLCEKPLATTAKECVAVKKASEDNHVTVQPVHNYLFTPSLISAQSLLQEKAIGRLVQIDMKFENSLSIYRPKTDFRLKRPSGIVEDLLPHALSITNLTAGRISEVKETQFSMKSHSVPDNAYFSFITDRRVPLHVTLSWTSLLPSFRIDFVGSEGKIELDLIRSPDSLRLTAEGKERNLRLENGPKTYLRLIRLEHPSFANQYLHFLHVIEGKENPIVTLDDEISIVETMEKITSSME